MSPGPNHVVYHALVLAHLDIIPVYRSSSQVTRLLRDSLQSRPVPPIRSTSCGGSTAGHPAYQLLASLKVPLFWKTPSRFAQRRSTPFPSIDMAVLAEPNGTLQMDDNLTQFSERSQDLGNIVHLEHLNLEVRDSCCLQWRN